MRTIGLVLAIFAIGFALAGLFFGHASWVGVNRHSLPVWLILEVIALGLLIGGFAMHVRANRD